MNNRSNCRISRRDLLKTAGAGVAGLSLSSIPSRIFGQAFDLTGHPGNKAARPQNLYFPPPESEGGWRTGDPAALGLDQTLLRAAVGYHDDHFMTTSYGGALLVLYKGHVVAESYTTGEEGGPQPWTARSCNDMKSSTKSVFGTAVGVFLDEFKDQVNLDSHLVGASRAESLIPQIWDQAISDPRKKGIKVKHVISMTSGHETREPWLAPSSRSHSPGYSGPFQMYEYCFGWWSFEGIPGHHTLKFQPGTDFNYSNYGLEQLALAMRNLSGQEVGPYLYDRVLGHIGMPRGIRDNAYRDMPYADGRELNFSEEPGWGVGGGEGCDAYGADKGPSPIGYNSIVGSTFRCTARDFARLAYLWLHGGRWEDTQVVPEAWLKTATSRFVRDDGTTPSPYGYTFWIQDELEGVPNDLFMSRGHNLNHSYVIPSLDLVVVRQGNQNRQPRGEPSFANSLIQKVVAALPQDISSP